jgi:glycosyltransferase involved in cell wall biosynthesis
MSRRDCVGGPRDRRASGPGKRICILVDSSQVGGIERHIELLASGLRRRGVDARVTLLADHGPNPWLDGLAAAGVPFDINRGGTRGLVRGLRRERADLVHTHGYKAGILGRIAARLLSIPVVSTFHAGEIGAFPVNLYQRVDAWTSVLASRVSVSPAIAERLPFRSKVIANFVNTPLGPPDGELPATVAFVGRLSHEKGPDIFCRAAMQSPPGVRWRIHGDGPMRGDLEEAFGDRVEFTGFVANMASVWPETGLLLMPSRAEGLPMAALEALAAGVPVAAARVGALPDVIHHGENGWLFEPGNLDAIRSIVGEWSRGAKDGGKWRHAAWRTARDRFGLDAGLERTLESYRDAGFRLAQASQ